MMMFIESGVFLFERGKRTAARKNAGYMSKLTDLDRILGGFQPGILFGYETYILVCYSLSMS